MIALNTPAPRIANKIFKAGLSSKNLSLRIPIGPVIFSIAGPRTGTLEAKPPNKVSAPAKIGRRSSMWSASLSIKSNNLFKISGSFSAILSINGAIALPSFPKAERILAAVFSEPAIVSAKAFSKLITD